MAPPRTEFSAHKRPSCASTMLRQIASPIPVPSGLVLKNGSNMRCAISGAIPGPRSSTETRTSSITVHCRSNGELARRGGLRHRLHRVHRQVAQNLLNLDRVHLQPGEIRRQNQSNGNLAANRLVTEDAHQILDHAIHVGRFPYLRVFAEQSAYAADNRTGACTLLNDFLCRRRCFDGIHRLAIEPLTAGICMSDYSRERLIKFMRNRCRHFCHAHVTRVTRQFLVRECQVLLRATLFFDVNVNPVPTSDFAVFRPLRNAASKKPS